MATKSWKILSGAAAISLLVACGGGGGGDRAAGVGEDAPPPPGGPVAPPPPVDPLPPEPPGYRDVDEIMAAITEASVPADGHVVIRFQVTDGNNVAITDLQPGDVRFVLAKLQGTPVGNLTGTWQSYINSVTSPVAGFGTGTEDRMQATYERDNDSEVFDYRDGEMTNNGNGFYAYRYGTNVNSLPQDYLDQAALEGLNLDYEPDRTHRVAIQFDNGPNPVNPFYDWVPETGETANIFTMDIANTVNCNRCHDPLAIHGGNRNDVEYCVTCHNPGSTDPESTNTVDFKVMIHKIHMGANLPSVQAGGEYIIWGFRNSEHDYSNIHYPQDLRNCQNCHVNTGTERADLGWYADIQKTAQGDNWNEYPTRAACASCHDDLSAGHGRGATDTECASCHMTGGIAGSPEESHRMLVREAGTDFCAEVVSVRDTAQGEFPTVNFRIFDPGADPCDDSNDPADDTDYDLSSDPAWTQGGGTSRLAVTLGWDTGDFTNTGNEGNNASTVSMDALADATPSLSGDGSYDITSSVAIPDGSLAPNVAAEGSGISVIEGHPAVDVEGSGSYEDTPLRNVFLYYNINEPDGMANERREVVELDKCLNCHETLVLHGGNRSDRNQSCVSCHNPRNTDFSVRPGDATDGKREESLDFKTMVHAIHAAGMRENPLQVVGFRGFSTHVYDADSVHYPGDLANCKGCHTDDGYQLPLASSVLATTNNTGGDIADPDDDTVTTPNTAVCSSCHDGNEATAHMEQNGGSFNTTQADIDDGLQVETCDLCHAEGRSAAVSELHGVE